MTGPQGTDWGRLIPAIDFANELSERDAEHRHEMKSLLLSLLEVLDSFDRLLPAETGAEPELPEIVTTRLIARQLARALDRVGVTAFPSLGARADPRRHEVVGTRPVHSSEHDEVVEVLQEGYDWQAQVLRPAQVIVGLAGEEVST